MDSTELNSKVELPAETLAILADISQEIAQRVESLDTKPKPKPKPQPEERKKTPSPPDAGLIVDWPNIADRMIEEMR